VIKTLRRMRKRGEKRKDERPGSGDTKEIKYFYTVCMRALFRELTLPET
jgi:hypothetical protein